MLFNIVSRKMQLVMKMFKASGVKTLHSIAIILSLLPISAIAGDANFAIIQSDSLTDQLEAIKDSRQIPFSSTVELSDTENPLQKFLDGNYNSPSLNSELRLESLLSGQSGLPYQLHRVAEPDAEDVIHSALLELDDLDARILRNTRTIECNRISATASGYELLTNDGLGRTGYVNGENVNFTEQLSLNCWSKFEDITDINAELSDLILNNIGVIHREDANGIRYCTGFLIRTNWIVTARHCFRNFFPGTLQNSSVTFKFSSAKSDSDLIQITEFLEINDHATSTQTDIAFAKLEKDIVSAIKVNPDPSTAIYRRSLFIPGFPSRETERLGLNTKVGFFEGLRFDSTRNCALMLESKDRCIRHACLTQPGMSGSPVFALSENDDHSFKLVGILEGGASPACGVDLGVLGENETRAQSALVNAATLFRQIDLNLID